MNRKLAVLMAGAVLWSAGIARADFSYTESSKVTGGMIAGMMKVAGAFSKKAREPVVTTTYVKGNTLRTETGQEAAQIIDLDGRRFIDLDLKKKTFTILTFDELRKAMEEAMAKARKESKDANVKIRPRVEIEPTGNTRTILGEETNEVKMKVEMEVEAEDAEKAEEARKMTFTVASDSWVAPSISGYKEIQRFYMRMARELNWLPGVVLGGDPQMAQGMMELKKGAAELDGLPLLQHARIGMAGMPLESAPPAEGAGGASSTQPAQTPSATASATDAAADATLAKASPRAASVKRLGGMLGGFGRKKKQQEEPPPEPAEETAATPAGAPGGASGSLAEMTIEVTSFSADALEASLFEIPAGFKEVKADPEKVLSGRR